MAKLDFGTAGIRGILGQGEYFLNIHHVQRVVEGYAKYLLKEIPESKEKGIVIGRDNRLKSKQFAYLSASILNQFGIKTYFSKDILATPIISYMIKTKKAAGGINITASHNPKEYNGIKIYNHTGAQILPDEVKKISKYFLDYEKYLDQKIEIKLNENNIWISKKEINIYIDKILNLGLEIDCSNINISYSPMHGTGAKIVPKILDKLKVKSHYVEKEMINNRFFTYVPSPNPEILDSYNGVLKLGKKYKSDLLLTTDPDADRIGVAVKKNNNEYYFLNGNETATLIFNFLMNEIYSKSNLNLKNTYMIYSFVSSTLPKIIANNFGVKSIEMATGFKWVGDIIDKTSLENKFLFAFEESYGSLIDEKLSYDKDAFQSVVLFTKMCAFYKKQNINVLDVLNDIYKKYGFITSKSISIDFDNSDVEKLNLYIKKFKKINFGIETQEILDYRLGINNIPNQDMIKINFKNNSWCAIRPSGTEPKIKFYIFSIEKTLEKSQEQYNKIWNSIKNTFGV